MQKIDVESNGNGTSNGKKSGVNGHDASSPEPEEYTYERAIQGYKSFAEKSVKAAASRPRVSPPKPGGRIGEKLSELEQVRLRSNSVSDVQLPKVDIHKRRSLFEVVESADTRSPSAERVARDLGGAQIVKARLSSLERRPDISPKPAPRVADEVCLSLKDRLSSLEKQTTPESVPGRRVEDLGHISIKERLTSLEKGLKESVNSNSCSDEEIAQKDLLSPAVSDREVSSPLVSSTPISHTVTEKSTTNQGFEVTNDNMVEGTINDKSGCMDSVSAKVEVAVTSPDAVQVSVDSSIVSDLGISKEIQDNNNADASIQMEPDSFPEKLEVNASSSVIVEKIFEESNVSEDIIDEKKQDCNHSIEKEKEPCDDSKAEGNLSSNQDEATGSFSMTNEKIFEKISAPDDVAADKSHNCDESVGKEKEPCKVSKTEGNLYSKKDEVTASISLTNEGDETSEWEKHTDSNVQVDVKVNGIEISSQILEVSSEQVEEEVSEAGNGETTGYAPDEYVEKECADTDVQVDIQIECTENSNGTVEVSSDEKGETKANENGTGKPADTKTDGKLKEFVKDIDVVVESVETNITSSSTLNKSNEEIKACENYEAEQLRDPSTKTTVETAIGSETATTLESTISVSGNKSPVTDGSLTKTVLEKSASTPDKKKSSPIKVSVTQTHRKLVKPALRTRKLTPILTAPMAVLSPVKAPGDLEMISEDAPMRTRDQDLQDIAEDEDGGASVRPVPKPRHNVKVWMRARPWL